MSVKTGPRLTAPSVAFVSALATAAMLVSGCGDNRRGDGVDSEDGSLNGELAIFVADDLEGMRSETQYALRAPNGIVHPLHFATPPEVEAGTPLKIWGTEDAGGLRVQSWKATPKAPGFFERVTSSLKSGMTYPAKRMAFVVVDIGGGLGTWTAEKAQAELTGPATNSSDPPTRDYYVEASYGTQDLDGRAFVLKYPMSTCGNNDSSGMATALRPMVDSMGGGSFNHYLWFFATKLGACGWSGLGEVGTPDKPANDTWYNASASCVVMVQEPGHNFGMQHSSSMACPGAPFSDNPDADCDHNEYGDPYDPMGGGSGNACRHMNAWQKSYNGWLQGCNVVQVKQSGQFTLLPMELGCDGVQALQIPMPKTRPYSRSGGGGMATTESLTHYYLELRTAKGLDTAMATNTVLVHVGGKLLGRGSRAVHTWILDMDQATSKIQGMTAGKTFSDPAGGVTFSVMELDASHATINVEMTATGGGPTCMDGTAFTAPGPGIESCNAGPTTTAGNGGASGGTGGAGGRGTGGTPGGTGGRGGTGGTAAGGGGGRATGGAGANASGGTAPGTGGAGTGGGIVATGGNMGNTGGAVGTGGTIVPGSGGGSGTADSGVSITPPEVTGGCACSTAGGTPGAATALAFGAMLLLGARSSRKRRRR